MNEIINKQHERAKEMRRETEARRAYWHEQYRYAQLDGDKSTIEKAKFQHELAEGEAMFCLGMLAAMEMLTRQLKDQ